MNKNYSGSIELISGLKQKNDLDFPLMEAHSVIVYEDENDSVGMRLDEKLKNVGISEETISGIISQATDAVFETDTYKNLDATVTDTYTLVTGAETGLVPRVEDLETKIEEGDNGALKIQYEQSESMLYLYEGDELIKPNPDDDSVISNVISSTPVSGGGSGTTLNYRLTLKILDDNSNLTFLKGDTAKIRYKAEFIDTTVEEGEDNLVSQTLNFKMTVETPSGKTIYSFKGDSNTELEYDLTKLISLGDNNIALAVSYTEEVGEEAIPVTIQSTKRWTVKIAEMYLTSTFDDSSVKTTTVPFTVRVFGDLVKTLHYELDGEPWQKTENISVTNKDYSITLGADKTKFGHGNHELTTYLTAVVNGKTITSNKLTYDIMFAEDGNYTPIIRARFNTDKFEQYSNIPIKYSVYTPNKLTSAVVLKENGEVVSSLTVDRAEQTWNYKPSDFGPKVLTLECEDTVRTLTFEVKKFPYDIVPVTAGLALDFNPTGRTNQDNDYDVFHNNVFDAEGNEVPLTWTISENFDWVNGGWQVDDKGDSYFCVKAGTSVDINYNLFADPLTVIGNNSTAGNGKEFKIIFKTANVARPDTTWLSCLEMPKIGSKEVGIKMDAHHGYVESNINTLQMPYSEEDIIEFDINIIPFTSNAKDIPMIMPYEDGTPSRPQLLTDSSISFEQASPVPITIGSPYCDVYIYRIKAYENYLKDEDILTNFIADARSSEEMVNRFLRNQIYDSLTNTVTPESLAAACPDLRIIKISAPKFTNDKTEKVKHTTVEMIHKNGDPVLDNWKALYAVHNGQGTSSNAYGYAGRNLELNLKNKKFNSYYITASSGIYNEDGDHYPMGSIIEEEFDFYTTDSEETRELIEDKSTVATITEQPGTEIRLESGIGEVVEKVSLTRDSVETNYFNVKVNIASSEHANNALLQKRYDRYLPYLSGAKIREPNIKNTMNFYNCVIFVQETDTEQDENGNYVNHREFNDCNYHFYSIGNIGDSKKTDDTRTTDPNDANEFCVEIMDWNRDLSAFPKDTHMRAAKYQDSKSKEYIFLTDEYLAQKALKEKVGGEYVEAPKMEKFNGDKYYFEYIDGKYVVTADEDNLNLKQDEAGNYLYDKTYYNHIGGEYVLSEDITIDSTKAYYIDILEWDDFSEDYTYGWRYALDDKDPEILAPCKAKWIEFYRFITQDLSYDDKRTDADGNILEDPEKIKTWKKEFANWFILDAALYYYLFTLRYTMVDNRAKNSFWHYGKCSDNKYRFDFWDYDNDTALGIDNTGKFTMDYGVEDHDVNEGGAAHFRAHNSTFFTRVADYFADELISYYKDTLEQNNPQVFSSSSLITEFDNWQSEFPEELWRLQYENVYKRTYVGGYGPDWNNRVNPAQIDKKKDPQFLTEMMNGKKKYQRRQFERNQDVYMSSKFFGSAVFQDYIKLRGGGDMDPSKFVVKPNGDITITPYLNMYINTSQEHNSTFDHHIKVKAGESVTLKYPSSVLEFNYIYGASYLQSLGDLSAMYLRTAELNNGSRLKQIILGNTTPGYNNPNLATLAITSGNKLLEELDIRNMSNLNGAIPISDIPSLRKLYAQGTNYSIAQFANNGLIEEAYLPSTLNSLKLVNLFYLTKLELENYGNLQSIIMENCPNIDSLTLAQQANNLKVARFTGIDWKLEEGDLLNKLLTCSGIGEDNSTPIEKSVLTGKVHLKYIRAAELAAYNEQWPELIVTFDNEIPQYTVSFTNNGETIYSMLVDEGTTLNDSHDPVKNGTIPTPTIPDSADGKLTYVFKEWKTADGKQFNGYTITNIDVTFQTIYDENIKYYKVKWYKTSTFEAGDLLETAEVPWGGNAEYSKELPTRPVGGNTYFLFEKWSDPSTNITKDTNIYAVWTSSNPNTLGGIDTKDLTATDVYALKQIGSLTGGSDPKFTTPGDTLTLQLGYMPSYENMTEQILIDSPRTFNGTSDYYNTGINLFQEDQSFTLAIDFEAQPDESSTAGSLVSCYYVSRNGFKLDSGTHSKVPTLYYKSASSTIPVGHMTPTKEEEMVGKDTSNTWRTHREICVIRKIKGDNTLYVYTNNRYEFNAPVECHDIPSTVNTFASIKNSLSFGAALNENGSASDFGKGIIHYAKLWNGDIGDDECRKVCSWIYTTMECEYVGKGLYNYEDSDVAVQGTFIAKNLLDEKMYMNNTSSNTDKAFDSRGYGPSDLRRWLQEKPFAGLSYAWKQTLSKSQVFSLEGAAKDTQNIVDTGNLYMEENAEGILVPPSDYFFLPSAVEMDAQYASKSNDNEIYLSESTNSFPIFTNNQDRIKRLANSDIEYGYWLRSPKQGQYSLGRFLGVAPTSQNNYGGQVQSQYQVESYYNFNGWRGSKQDFGVLLTFSI